MVALTMWAMGMPKSLVMAMMGPIQKIKYHLCTGFGVSNTHFGEPGLGCRVIAKATG